MLGSLEFETVTQDVLIRETDLRVATVCVCHKLHLTPGKGTSCAFLEWAFRMGEGRIRLEIRSALGLIVVPLAEWIDVTPEKMTFAVYEDELPGRTGHRHVFP